MRSVVKRCFRMRKVYYIDVLEIEGRDVFFRVGVEVGIYICLFIYYIGFVFGVGVYMVEFRRIRSGFFKEDEIFVIFL